MLQRLFALAVRGFDDRSVRSLLGVVQACLLLTTASIANATTWTVNNTGDPATGTAANCASGNAGTCTLRDAVAAATGGETIAFAVGSNKTIGLSSATSLTLGNAITIDGSGSPGLTIDGQHATSVFNAQASVAITGLAIVNAVGSFGAAVLAAQPVTLTRVSISGSSASQGILYVTAAGNLTLDQCSISGNSVLQGVINAFAPVTISRSTIWGNDSRALYAGANVSIDNSTLGNNVQVYGSPNVTFANSTFAAGVIVGSGTLQADNTIFAGGCSFGVTLAGSDNLDSGTSCGLPAGASNAFLHLGPLQDNGGPTPTMLPGRGSAAIDAGSDSVCASAPVGGIDQRGVTRPQGTHCDVGAVEAPPHDTICYVRFDANGANDGTSWADAYTDLQDALTNEACDFVRVARGVYKPTPTSDRSVSFRIPPNAGVYGGFSGVGSQREPAEFRTILSGDIDGNDAGADGIDANTSQIVGDNSYHVVVIDGTAAGSPAGRSTTVDGFTITGGKADGSGLDGYGGGVACDGSGAGGLCDARLSNLNIVGNFASNAGGGLFVNGSGGGSASPLVLASTFSGNLATNGGGGTYIFTGATGGTTSPTYVDDTFSGNGSAYGAAIYTSITSGSGTVALTNITSSGNTAGSGGAYAEYSCGGAPTVLLTNVILWGDSGPAGNEELVVVCDSPTFKHSVVMGGIAGFGVDGGGNVATDPLLGPFQDNGGYTPTLMIGAGSSAIDAGLDSACTAAPESNVDQRGFMRPVGAHCDIGAVEASNLTLTVNDNSLFALYGKTIQYVVTLKNNSLTDTISDVPLEGFGSEALYAAGALWFCTIGSCTTAQTGGPFSDTATLPPTATLIWIVNVPVLQDSLDATATMTIRSTGAAAVSDVDTLAIFRGTFDGH